ncbi:MAG: thioredoxin domain-containing protein [Pseudomonadota bacterium]
MAKRVCGALAIASLLSACSAASLSSGLEPTAQNAGAPLTTASVQPKRAPFDPFKQDTGSSYQPREVIKNPTLAQVLQKGPLPEYALGRTDAPVTVIKYVSLTCPFCRRFQKTVFPPFKRAYIDTGKVRFIMREFPIGRQSGTATIAWRCAPKRHYFKLYDAFLFSQPRWVSQEVRTGPILKVAARYGLTAAAYNACLKDQRLVAGLKAVKQRGRLLGVIGTPNFFINNKLVKRVLTLDGLRAHIDPLLQGAAAARNASAR